MKSLFQKIILIFSVLFFTGCSNAQEQNTRPAGVAGGFYPKEQKQLTKMIDGFLQNVPDQKIENDIFAIISPHAGYVYSGQVAAFGYSTLKNQIIERVKSHLLSKEYSAETFEKYALQGTPSTILIDRKGILRDVSFGQTGHLDSMIQKLIDEG